MKGTGIRVASRLEITDCQNRKSVNPAYLYLVSLSSGSSRYNMEQILLRFVRFFGGQQIELFPWQKLRVEHIAAYKAQLIKAEKSPNTVNVTLAALKGVLRAAWQLGQISDHDKLAVDSIKPVRGQKIEKGRCLSSEEVHKLLESCVIENSAKGFRDAALISSAVGLGLRRSELSNALLGDLDLFDLSLKVRGKGNKERLAFGSQIVWTNMKEWLKFRGQEPGFLFCCVDKHNSVFPKRKLSPNSVFCILKTKGEELAMKSFAPHDMRRTFATRLLESGVDIFLVKEAMGHASVSTTQRYDKRDISALKEAVEKVVF